MAVVILGEETGRDRVQFGVSPLAELGAALHVLTAIDHVGNEWAANTWAELPEELRAECQLFAPLWTGYRSRLLYPADLASAGDLDAELNALDQLPIEVFVEHVGYSLCLRDDGRDLSELLSDASTREWLRRHARGRGTGAAADLLLVDADEFHNRLVAFLRACWASFFAASWERIAPRLRGEIATRQALAHRVGLLPSLAAISPVASLGDAPPRLYLDKMHQGAVNLARTPLLVVPSLFGHPHLLVKHEEGWPAVFQYPIPLSCGAPPIARDILRQRLRVLADPTKLRLCRALARHARSTRELAEWADMTPPEVARHLRALREAQFVTTQRSGRYVYYSLDPTAVRQLGEQTLDVLLR